jgi:hypothetical protein
VAPQEVAPAKFNEIPALPTAEDPISGRVNRRPRVSRFMTAAGITIAGVLGAATAQELNSSDQIAHAEFADTSQPRVPAQSVIEVAIADPLTETSGTPTEQSFFLSDVETNFVCNEEPSRTVTLNMVATDPTAPGFLQIFSEDIEKGKNSNVNYLPGQTVNNLVFARADSEGIAKVFTLADTHIVLDKQGEFAPGTVCDGPDVRKVDTRGPAGNEAMPAAGSFIELTGVANTTAAANLTAIDARGPGYLQIVPSMNSPELAKYSNINYNVGDTVARETLITYGADGKAYIYSPFGNVHIALDQHLIFMPGAIEPVNQRILDTRLEQYGGHKLVGGSIVKIFGLPGRTAIVSIASTENTMPSFLQVLSPGIQYGETSDVNMGSANKTFGGLSFAQLDDEGEAFIYLGHGETHVVVDVLAYTAQGQDGQEVFIDTPNVRVEDTRLQPEREVISQSGPNPIQLEDIEEMKCQYTDEPGTGGFVKLITFVLKNLAPDTDPFDPGLNGGDQLRLEYTVRASNGPNTTEYYRNTTIWANQAGTAWTESFNSDSNLETASKMLLFPLTITRIQDVTGAVSETKLSVNVPCIKTDELEFHQ